MGIYGVSTYGQSKFGYDPGTVSLPGFSAYPFTADAVGYSAQSLLWTRPVSTFCSRLRLVRNRFNIPANENDGLIIFDRLNGLPNSFLDRGVIGGFVYYSLFGYDSNPADPNYLTWVRSADLVALTPLQWGYGDIYYNLLPEMYRNRDYLLVDTTNPDPTQQTLNPPLQRFLNLLGYQVDILRTEIETLLLVNDPINCSGNLLPLLAAELGMVYEHEMGMKQARNLIANAVHLYKRKGSSAGISEFVSSLTGYPVAGVAMGRNRLPYRDDSVGATSVGSWVVNDANGTLITPQNLQTLYGKSPTAIAGNLGILPAGFNGSAIQIKSPAGGTAVVIGGLVPISDFVDINGIGSVTLNLQFFTPTGTTARSITLTIYDDLGNVVATSATNSVVNAFTTMTASVALASPPGKFLRALISLVGMAVNEVQFFTLAGLYNIAPLPAVFTPQILYYDYPRDLKITVEPADANLFGNPLTTFFNGIDGWTSDVNPVKTSAVSGMTVANPGVVTTAAPHGLTTGQQITIEGVVGTTEANGSWIIASTPTSTTFTLPIAFTHAWVSGGVVYGPETMSMSIEYTEQGDTSNIFGVYGAGCLQATSLGLQAPVIYGGGASSLIGQTPQPGWSPDWGGNGNWFGGAVTTYTGGKQWFNNTSTPTMSYGDYLTGYTGFSIPSSGWFFDSTGFFESNSAGIQGGDWFVQNLWVQDVHALPVPIVPQPNMFYTFSVYMRMAGSTTGTAQLAFFWIMADGSTQVTSPTQVALTDYFVSPKGDISRYSAQAETPNDASGNPAVGLLGMISFPGAVAGDAFMINAAMLDTGAAITPYFDSYLNPGNSDYVFGIHGGSYFYPRQESKAARLNAVLPSWIPMGASYSLIFSVPGG